MAQELISARLDGELRDEERKQVEAHLEQCARCQQQLVKWEFLQRQIRVRAVPFVPDLSGQILARVQGPRRVVLLAARIGLLAVGLAEFVSGVLELTGGHGAPTHDRHHASVLAIAVATGLVFSALQPRLAAGLIPVVSVMAVTNLVIAALDVRAGRATAGNEAQHVLEAVGLLLIWRIAGRPVPKVSKRISTRYG